MVAPESPARAEPVLVPGQHGRVAQVDVLAETRRGSRIGIFGGRLIRIVGNGLPPVESPVSRVGQRGYLLGVQYEGEPHRGGKGGGGRLRQCRDRPVDGHIEAGHLRGVVVPGHDVVRRVLDQAGVNGILVHSGPAKRPNVDDNPRIRSGWRLAGPEQGEEWGVTADPETAIVEAHAPPCKFGRRGEHFIEIPVPVEAVAVLDEIVEITSNAL
jgi:hypothetical protein